MKCKICNKDIVGGAKIQEFDPVEPTTMHVFCSEQCKKKWLKTFKK